MDELHWKQAKAHFEEIEGAYKVLPPDIGGLALTFTFEPLRSRFEAGERTQQLYDEMMAVS